MLQESIPHATPETPIHHPCTSQILCLYPPTPEKSWNKRNPVPCKSTMKSQFYSVGIPRDLQSCTTSTNQRRKIKAKQEYIPAKELLACYMAQACSVWSEGKSTYTCLMGTWQSSGRGFLPLWPPIQSWLDFHAQWKWIQKANESGLHAFILLEANLDAQSCFHNGQKPF